MINNILKIWTNFMPYSKEHKQNSRERILNSAVELFSRRGFDGVSIDDLMQHAKLTRGAFYAHFASKGDVYFHSITQATMNAITRISIHSDYQGEAWLKHFIHSYLSNDHIDRRNSPCPLAFMVTDVATSDAKVKSAYTRVFDGFAKALRSHMPQDDCVDAEKRQRSLAASAMLIGSVAIGRVLKDRKLRDELLESSSRIAQQLLISEST